MILVYFFQLFNFISEEYALQYECNVYCLRRSVYNSHILFISDKFASHYV